MNVKQTKVPIVLIDFTQYKQNYLIDYSLSYLVNKVNKTISHRLAKTKLAYKSCKNNWVLY